jgi:hypothetical protein
MGEDGCDFKEKGHRTFAKQNKTKKNQRHLSRDLKW